MKLNISVHHLTEVLKKGYSFDQILMIGLIEEGVDFGPSCVESIKIATIYQSIIRKALISENGEKLTTIGQELIQFVNSKTNEKLIKKKPTNTEFDQWWQAYPGTDNFEYKNRKFVGSRSLRADKDNCRVKFNKILIEGEYSAIQLIEALNYDVLQKREMSLKQGTNKLTFMQNSLTYLNQRSFEPFIELLSKGETIKESEDVYDGINI